MTATTKPHELRSRTHTWQQPLPWTEAGNLTGL